MNTYRYSGIVIKRKNIGEADRLIVLFTKETGKIKVIAKGIRKISSKRAPHLEIFSQVKFFVHESRSYPYITEAQLIYGFINLRKNLRKIAIAYHLCEVIEKILPEREKNAQLYDLFLATLIELEKETDFSKVRQNIRLFIQNFLLKLGYLSSEKIISYSQLLYEIENIIERPLTTPKLLIKLAKIRDNSLITK